jgi:hypothetical protein
LPGCDGRKDGQLDQLLRCLIMPLEKAARVGELGELRLADREAGGDRGGRSRLP